MSLENVKFEARPNADGGDPGKLAYLHNADFKSKPFVDGFKVAPGQCPGCIFPDAAPGKWPHVKDARCKAWARDFADYMAPNDMSNNASRICK